jgi:hypothetical protein
MDNSQSNLTLVLGLILAIAALLFGAAVKLGQRKQQ